MNPHCHRIPPRPPPGWAAAVAAWGGATPAGHPGAARRDGRAAAAIAALALSAVPALAATVEVQVVDAAGKPIANAAVFLESPAAKAAVQPQTTVEVAQVNKQFVPEVTVVPLGTPVTFPNQDVVRHHIYSFSPIKPFEIKLYTGKPSNPVVFDRAGVAVLGCNIHDTMAAWIVVVETPYHGRSGADGRVRLDNVPAGAYRLRTWHLDLPVGAAALDQALAVPAAGVSLTMAAAAAGAR